MSKKDLMRYWPVAAALLVAIGATATFYFTTQAVAADVLVIKAQYARTNVVDLKFLIVENSIDNLDEKVDDNEDRTVKQLEGINEKLDQLIQGMLLQNLAGEPN